MHRSIVVAAAACLMLGSGPARAQFSNQCRTVLGGFCAVNVAPYGSSCGCFTPSGPVPGQIVPGGGGPVGGGFFPGQQALSNACRTYRGACPIYPQPIGTPCSCSGDPGSVSP